jgi:hypothetical protein
MFSRGIDPAQLPSPPPAGDLPRITAEYKSWNKYFEESVIRKAPVYLKVVQAHEKARGTVESQRVQRIERMELVYGDLITLAKVARDQAKTLTDNAGFISMANNVARMANRFLGDVTKETKEATEGGTGTSSAISTDQ